MKSKEIDTYAVVNENGNIDAFIQTSQQSESDSERLKKYEAILKKEGDKAWILMNS